MKNARGGFTLLETIVALVVLGFLIVGLTAGVRFALGARKAEGALIAKGEGLDAVDRTLRGLITNMDPGAFEGPPTLRGGPERMVFLTELPPEAEINGVREARITLAVDSDHRLVLGWRLAPHAVPLAPPPQGQVVLLDDVARVAIAYAEPAANGGGWVRQWGTVGLPALVRVRIVFAADDRRLWPDIVAAPMRARV
ncbi:MAG TPA: prepilin-type N-terminal cleavage/methylation domain-containing protein, partial [Acetobacteraceae bacterium]|nr:prepilin-type N-terminal cleavage/methylation domain-containing protein [Acetobacteraceae bacterium]